MSHEPRNLADRIREAVLELEQVVARIETGWQRARVSADDYYLDGVALNLHGFYGGLERLFELIATQVDDALPEGANWHKALLDQVTLEVPGVRPGVISEESRDGLEPFRGFRHVVRNVYTHTLNPGKMESLVTSCAPLFGRLQVELLAFARFLELADAGEK